MHRSAASLFDRPDAHSALDPRAHERWVEEFRETGGALRAALGELALRIDHIGSTSVPGLGAKDCVDLQVTA
jgi:GrpB-like predicted nucleotidyltransferase (UPF0157 family)